MTPYRQLLKAPQWKEKAARIRHRDRYTCTSCGGGGILHVHHLRYPPKGRPPWEVPDSWLTSLCASCHSKSHGKDGGDLLDQIRGYLLYRFRGNYAEDIASAGILKVIQVMGKVDESKGNQDSYLRFVAKNAAIDEARALGLCDRHGNPERAKLEFHPDMDQVKGEKLIPKEYEKEPKNPTRDELISAMINQVDRWAKGFISKNPDCAKYFDDLKSEAIVKVLTVISPMDEPILSKFGNNFDKFSTYIRLSTCTAFTNFLRNNGVVVQPHSVKDKAKCETLKREPLSDEEPDLTEREVLDRMFSVLQDKTDIKIVNLRLKGQSVKEVSKAVGISATTIYRRLRVIRSRYKKSA